MRLFNYFSCVPSLIDLAWSDVGYSVKLTLSPVSSLGLKTLELLWKYYNMELEAEFQKPEVYMHCSLQELQPVSNHVGLLDFSK